MTRTNSCVDIIEQAQSTQANQYYCSIHPLVWRFLIQCAQTQLMYLHTGNTLVTKIIATYTCPLLLHCIYHDTHTILNNRLFFSSPGMSPMCPDNQASIVHLSCTSLALHARVLTVLCTQLFHSTLLN